MNLRHRISTAFTAVTFTLTISLFATPALATFSHENGFSPAYHGSQDNDQRDWRNLGRNWDTNRNRQRNNREGRWHNNDQRNWGKPGGRGNGGDCWGNNGNNICTVSPC